MDNRYGAFEKLYECLKYVYENGEFYHSAIESLGASFGKQFEREVSDALTCAYHELTSMEEDGVTVLIRAWENGDARIQIVWLGTPTWVEIGERPMSGEGKLHRIDQALVVYGQARLWVRPSILSRLTEENLFEFFGQMRDEVTLAVQKLVKEELSRDDGSIYIEVKTSDRLDFRAVLEDGNYEKP